MIDAERVRSLLAERRSGFSLPQGFYTDPALHAADLEAVFGREWLFACPAAEIPRAGDWHTLDVGADSVVVVRGRDGEVRAFHNVCRHRGSRVCLAEGGHSTRLVCPYHQWLYDLDGRLLRARRMPDDLDLGAYGLKPVAVEVVAGMVHVCLADEPPSLAQFRAAVTPFIAPHAPERTKVAHASTLIEEANWKLVIENNRECYHCAAGHPELLATFYEVPRPEDARGTAEFEARMARITPRWAAQGLPWEAADGGETVRCIRLPLNEGAHSFTMDGHPACRRLLADFTDPDPDLGSVRMFRAPNNWNHFLSDHVIHFRVLPLGPDRTAVRTTWLVHEDAMEGVDYDVARLTEVWTATNVQDGRFAAWNHRGIASRAYEPGPYAPDESMLTGFTDWYAGRMEAFYGAPTPLRLAAE